MSEKKNLVQVFTETVKRLPDKTFYSFKKDGKWEKVSYAEFARKVYALAALFEELGVKKGDKIALLSENRLEWALTDYASLHIGSAIVPIYTSLLENQVQYIIDNCDAKIAIASNEMQAQKLKNIKEKLGKVEHFIQVDGLEEGFMSFWDKLEEKLKDSPDYSNAGDNISPDDLATLIYTSGTTGFPKGVMLTHWNFLSNVIGGLTILPITNEETFLSFLPLSHVFERMAGHYLPMYKGCTICYAEGIDYVAQNMNEVHPTVMTSVPRLYEKMHTKIVESVEEGSGLKKKIFYWSLEQGKKVLNLKKRGLKPGGMLGFKLSLAEKLVFSKLKEKLGGKIRFFVSGGAPLSKEVAEFFAYAGIYILEGYGLTETSPVIAVNPYDGFKFGTVGKILPNVEVKIADDGEILTKGPHVMVGYYKNEDETKEAIDPDGWFHTGDIGYIDEDGYLVITDRKKNIIVTSGGKNIAPQPIEGLLTSSRYIEQAVLIGDRRKFCSALIVPNLDALKSWAEGEGISAGDTEALLKDDRVIRMYREEIDRLSVDLASYETIKKFSLLPEPFSIETGELTPTLKVKRKIVEEKYKDILDAFYAD
jgi:long-chain acyl-CoA synthetase